MARAKFIIGDDDAYRGYEWIKNKISEYDFPYSFKQDGEGFSAQNEKAEEEFKVFSFRDSSALNAWAESHLDKDQWRKLKNAIRAARVRLSRKQDSSKMIRRVDLEHKAHLILLALAKSDGVTLSEVVYRELEEKWEKLPVKEKFPS